MSSSTRAFAISPPRAAWRWDAAAWLAAHPTVTVASLFLAAVALIAVLAPFIATHDPELLAPRRRMQLPSAESWFGTDVLGRDVFSRVVYGARVSLAVGLTVAAASCCAGLLIGLFASFNRTVDSIVMRFMDGLMSIPSILLAIALMTLSGPSVSNVIFSITVAEIPRVVRLVRSLVLSLREQPFVEAAIASGTRLPQLLWRHILPNTLSPLLVQGTFIFAAAMIIEATLSFLGAGTPPSIPSWGNMIADGRNVFQIRPSLVLFPGVVLSLTVVAVNLLGDGLRDALDPRKMVRL
jgi:peptide/nickel transport system permease protein